MFSVFFFDAASCCLDSHNTCVVENASALNFVSIYGSLSQQLFMVDSLHSSGFALKLLELGERTAGLYNVGPKEWQPCHVASKDRNVTLA